MWLPEDFQHLQELGELLDRWVLRRFRRSVAAGGGAGARLRAC